MPRKKKEKVVFSKIQQDLLIRLGVAAEKIAVIPNGVDEQKYSPGYSHIKYKFQAKKLFVYQGRISTENKDSISHETLEFQKNGRESCFGFWTDSVDGLNGLWANDVWPSMDTAFLFHYLIFN